jgi:ferredoxin-NADP reductase
MTAAATWPIFHSKLVRRQEVAERTVAFHLEKPSGWTFKAGQFLDITLASPPETDAEGNKRGFSIASAPEEATIMVGSRMRDTAFKRVLQTMPLGTAVTVEGPFGNLTLHNNPARAAVILSGGIGITPFRSILVDAARRKLPQRIFVFCSNRRPEDAPFLDELLTLQTQNPNYELIATMDEMAKSHRSWNGETGRIDKALLSRHLRGAASPITTSPGRRGWSRGCTQCSTASA